MPREMKDSGIEWIGDIPENWKVVPIKIAFSEVKTKNTDGTVTNALKFKFGEIVPKTNFDSETDDYVADTILNYTIVEPRMIMINGLNLNYDFKTLRTGLVKEKGIITSAYLALKPIEEIVNAEYATYLFKGYETKMAFHNMGAGIRLTLGFKEFKNQPLLLPPLSEQEAIADFLDKQCAEIDAVIEQTKATIEEYKKLKQSVITEAVTKGIRGDRPMKDSGIEWIGEIPSEWKSIKLKYCTYIRARLGWKGLKADEYVDEGYPLLSAFNIINSKLDFAEVNYINQFRYDESPEIKLAIDDILLVKDGAGIGKCAIVEELPIPSTPNGSLAVVTITNHLYPKFLYYYFLSKMFQKYIDRIKDGMGVPHLFQSDLREIEIVISSMEEQKEIVVYLDQKCAEIDTLIEKKTALLEEMEALKKSTIFEYVTGKKKVLS